MFTSILIGLLCYSLFLLVMCIGWHRHCKMTEAYDRAVEEAVKSNPNRIVAAGVRPYPE